MSMSANDVVIKTIIEAGLEEMVKNPYLVQDALGVFICNPLLAKKYGQKEIDNAINWIQNNKIEVAMRFRNDKDQFPLVSIEMGDAPLKVEQQTLGDDRPQSEGVILKPCDIDKPIPYIVKPFTPISYDPDTGFVELPKSVKTRFLRAGQIIVNTTTGQAYEILSTNCGVYIAPGSEMSAGQLAVAPRNAFWKANKKAVFFQETWKIGCHVHGDVAPLLWLHTIVKYILLRYRAALERSNMSEIVINNSPLQANADWGATGGEMHYSRFVTISNITEESWIDDPARILEAVEVVDNDNGVLKPGIKILSNLDSPPDLDTEDQPWSTVEYNQDDQ